MLLQKLLEIVALASLVSFEGAARYVHHRHGTVIGCSRCPPGHAVLKHCTRSRNTYCTSCRQGTYQTHHTYKRVCYSCSLCGDGLYVAHPCTLFSDTVCDSCHTINGSRNDDFHRKCTALGNKQRNQTKIAQQNFLVQPPYRKNNAAISARMKTLKPGALTVKSPSIVSQLKDLVREKPSRSNSTEYPLTKSWIQSINLNIGKRGNYVVIISLFVVLAVCVVLITAVRWRRIRQRQV
ncbi:uncharacterized protein LOC143237369 isoform X2 [Tachypleus tridentatus]|uniref:uncharacterized protein LOC143237369 isoform X2 n=1 Tax=Tachypleus tridentatus TaxID=6853 RepID=UPI003FD6231A